MLEEVPEHSQHERTTRGYIDGHLSDGELNRFADRCESSFGTLIILGLRSEKLILLTKSYLGPEIATAVRKPHRLMRVGFLTFFRSILWNRGF
jgi:hypothetical protein